MREVSRCYTSDSPSYHVDMHYTWLIAQQCSQEACKLSFFLTCFVDLRENSVQPLSSLMPDSPYAGQTTATAAFRDARPTALKTLSAGGGAKMLSGWCRELAFHEWDSGQVAKQRNHLQIRKCLHYCQRKFQTFQWWKLFMIRKCVHVKSLCCLLLSVSIMPACMSLARLLVYPSICPSIHLFIHPSVSLYVHLSHICSILTLFYTYPFTYNI